MDKYVRAGRELRQLTVAFLQAKSLAAFATRVESAIGITVSIGLSINKFLATIASDLDKPRGFSVLTGNEAQRFWRPNR